jgi:FkbM family methyltransferase
MNQPSKGTSAMPLDREDTYKCLEQRYFSPQMDEAAELAAFPEQIKSVNVFFDVGAAIGQYTKAANERMRGGHIFAFEADPVRFERLKENCARWEKSSTNKITAIHAAVCDKDQPISFLTPEDSLRSGGLFIPGPPEQTKKNDWLKLSVQGISLDTFCETNKLTPDLVKIDIEGAEYRALIGAKKILRTQHCRFLVEVHPWGDLLALKKPSDVFNLFCEHGYDFTRVERHWHFEKAQNSYMAWIKNSGMTIVLDNPLLTKVVKTFMLKFVLSKR